jgi:hypothetical protein
MMTDDWNENWSYHADGDNHKCYHCGAVIHCSEPRAIRNWRNRAGFRINSVYCKQCSIHLLSDVVSKARTVLWQMGG